MSAAAEHFDAADHALREVCKSLLAVAADDTTIYALLQDLAKIGQNFVVRKEAALKDAQGEERMFVGAGI